MTLRNAQLHVYQREITQQERTSLSVLSGLIKPGSTVLDLGCGSGALGRYLAEAGNCIVDGVTFNEEEAALARPAYRNVEVADLDRCDLLALFPGRHYDAIVCADVLEHLRTPEATLEACKPLLTPAGQVLISIPNAGYAGLIAELLQGEFLYREEGLLDRTHLRFFTRQSLSRFLEEHRWGIQSIDTIQRNLPDSEFKVYFDQLPPAVSRYLVGIPDALTYQFIVAAQPGKTHAKLAQPESAQAHALFTASVYFGNENGFSEELKQEATGVIGTTRQVLRFDLPEGETVTRLKFDPADRPGFIHLHEMNLCAKDGELLWQWRVDVEGLKAIEECPTQDMLLRGPGLGSPGAMALLYSEDPWIELPLAEVLARAAGGSFEVNLGWPMSADFLSLADSMRQTSLQNKLLREKELERLHEILTERERNWKESTSQQERTALAQNEQLQTLAHQNRSLLEEKNALLAHKNALLEHKNALVAEQSSLQTERDRLSLERNNLHQHLQWLENSTVFRATRPLVKAKMWVDAQVGRGPRATNSVNSTPPSISSGVPEVPVLAHPVDVIVPVYRGLADTQRCIQAALASPQQSAWRLIVINDCSPEPEVTSWLRELAAREPRMTLLENVENLGFVATVNRGMSVSQSNDVVLLNSDAEVANDWLDRLVRAAHCHGRVGTVTPFSNNATICSYPRFCEDNALPDGYDTARLDQLFSQLHLGRVLDVPTGIGFCMYIRRDCLQQVGLFDLASFGKGYGEENDFCQRAQQAGWRNLHALDTFVLHSGGVSFGESKSQRELDAMEILRRLHPNYERQVHQFVGVDPARLFRQQVDLARFRAANVPVVLAVLHDRAGGTVRHVRELAKHMQDHAIILSLTPAPGGHVRLESSSLDDDFLLTFNVDVEFDQLIEALRDIGVSHVHYHHLIGHSPKIKTLATQLGVAYDFTAHDFYTLCPQISLTSYDNTYCGEKGVEQCRDCLRRSPAPGGADIETWRATHAKFVTNARHVLAPSRDAATRMIRFVPAADVRVAPHTDLAPHHELPTPTPNPLEGKRQLKVVILGALSAIKGADVLEDLAILAARQKAPIEFHLLGYAYRNLRTQPKASLTIHGEYVDAELPTLLEWLQPDLVWFPAQWPETYSYTLSACMDAGLPVVAPDIGAFPERLAGRSWTWITPWDQDSAQLLAFFLHLRENHFATGIPPSNVPSPQDPVDASSGIGSWSYESDYLEGVSQKPMQNLSVDFLLTHQGGASRGSGGAKMRAKETMFLALVRLRSSRVLRQVAKAVPLRWQTRVKTWLRS